MHIDRKPGVWLPLGILNSLVGGIKWKLFLHSQNFYSKCVDVPHKAVLQILWGHQLGVLKFNSILTFASQSRAVPTGQWLSPTRLPLTSDANCKYGVPRWPTLLSDLATNWTFLWPPPPSSVSIICYNNSQNPGKYFIYDYQSITENMTKDTNEKPNEEVQRVKSRRVPSAGACLHGVWGAASSQLMDA